LSARHVEENSFFEGKLEEDRIDMIPTVLLASESVSSGLLWKLRLRVKNIALVTEPNLSKVVHRSLVVIPDLIVLDLNPNNPKGIYLIHELREAHTVPLLVLLSNQYMRPGQTIVSPNRSSRTYSWPK
jgi:hypothetical protein